MGTPLTPSASHKQMLSPVIRPTLLALALLLAACGSSAALPTPSPTASAASATPAPSATLAPSPSPTASPSASRSPIPLPNSAQVAAAGNGVVWVQISDRLFRSTDRGETWSERGSPSPMSVPFVTNIAFVNATQGWILSTGAPATQCQSQSFEILRTTDGAATWQSVSAASDTAQCKENLAFVDAQHGYMTSYDPNSAPQVWRTTDGGAHWSSSRVPDPPGFTTRPGGMVLRLGPVADFGSVLLVAAIGPGGGRDEPHYVFRSTDGGATWTSAGKMPWADVGPIFLTASRWFELILPGPSSETTDGGASWHPFTTDYQQAAPIAPQIVFGDTNTGYATVRGALQRSSDGGAHWTSLRTPGT